ncbi:hypothetical protein JCGZ_09356 [Jatropha curcas]|uniref:Uncharacterized protein n=1 Tax=Jatropha curcas TaxID=180498 RepID=A0A067KGG0_JATCU|nr:hypothetical protein JCGZ_09356 [Jatropha curcas]
MSLFAAINHHRVAVELRLHNQTTTGAKIQYSNPIHSVCPSSILAFTLTSLKMSPLITTSFSHPQQIEALVASESNRLHVSGANDFERWRPTEQLVLLLLLLVREIGARCEAKSVR